MRRLNLRESLSVRVSSFLLFLKNDPPDPEKDPAQTALWNDYIEGLNLGAGDIAKYREAPPEKEALVERLFAAGVKEETNSVTRGNAENNLLCHYPPPSG